MTDCFLCMAVSNFGSKLESYLRSLPSKLSMSSFCLPSMPSSQFLSLRYFYSATSFSLLFPNFYSLNLLSFPNLSPVKNFRSFKLVFPLLLSLDISVTNLAPFFATNLSEY